MKNLINRPDLLGNSNSFSAISKKRNWQDSDDIKMLWQDKKRKKKFLERN
jgi:hypothetical protein